MKNPLFALRVCSDADLRRRILTGEITCTIRRRHRDYRKSEPLMLGCRKDLWIVEMDMTDVHFTYLNEVTEQQYRAAGYASRQDLEAAMRRYYQDDMYPTMPVTLIFWTNVRGALVDVARNAQPAP